MSKWNTMWGTAISVAERREGNYAKELTLRYALKCTLNGSKIRVRFSNVCGSEEVKLNKVVIAPYLGDTKVDSSNAVMLSFNGKTEGVIPAGAEITSDEADFICKAGEDIAVSMYLKEFTQLMSCVYTEGPCQDNFFSNGNNVEAKSFTLENRMPSNYTYFLDTIDVLTDDTAKTVVLYGDSITAQSWPDRLNLMLLKNNKNTAAIRRGVSGTRILGQYDCLQYAHYGLSGKNRFLRECNVSNADTVLIFQGINDIIHPDGVNPFRPMSNYPSLEEMKEGFRYYINEGHKMGLKVILATILPIKGWRTYEAWRDDLRMAINDWIKTTDEVEGFVDFDAALRDKDEPMALFSKYDSGDHLHPSQAGAQVLAEEMYKML